MIVLLKPTRHQASTSLYTQHYIDFTRTLYVSLLYGLLTNTSFANDTNHVFSVAAPPFAPFVYTQPSEQCLGIVPELIAKITQNSNFIFKLKQLPYARIINNLHYGLLDSAVIFKNQKLLFNNGIFNNIHYIGPLALSKVIVMSREPINSYDDLATLKAIAVIRKASFEMRFDLDTEIRKSYVENYQQGLKMMLSGRADAVIGSQIGIEHSMLMLDIKVSDYNSFQISQKEWGFHINKDTFSAIQQQTLQKIVDQNKDLDLLYTLYKNQLPLHAKCSKKAAL